MNKNEHENRRHSAYDELINSSDYEDLDSDIAYFSSKPTGKPETKAETQREATPSRRKVVPKKVKKPVKRVQTSPEERPVRQDEDYLKRQSDRARKKKQKQAANDNFNVLIASFIVTAIILAASLATLASGDKQYSENENRYLAGRPSASVSTIADGKFMKDIESYLSDQFAGRGALVKARTNIDIFFGKKEVNNVYIGKDHFLFEKPEEYNSERMAKTLKAVNDFSKKHKKINSYFAIAPDSSEILSDLMPSNAPATNQSEQIKTIYKSLDKSIKSIDICTTLKNSDNKESLYYRTDHHWTTTAAEIAFKQIAANMKLNSGKVNYESFCVTNDFQGTLASSSGLFNAKDNIFITVPKTDIKYAVNFVSENRKSASMFDSEKLKQKNQYEVFFGGNFGEIKIDTTLNSKKVLMVVKDSYANCLIPMLMPYYKSIVIIDPRYFKDDINTVIKNESVTDILWLYNANTFLADTSIVNVIK